MQPPVTSTSQLIAETTTWVQACLQSNDASHDWQHIERVLSTALRLAHQEGVTDENDLLVIRLSALLHDVADHKYTSGRSLDAVHDWLTQQHCPSPLVHRVMHVIRSISFSTELATLSHHHSQQPQLVLDVPVELAIVQDADRLDAIGAIGVARCFTFGGARARPLYTDADLTRTSIVDDDTSSKAGVSGVGHFYDKLLKVAGMMKTRSGKQQAKVRHEFMIAFLQQLRDECGAASHSTKAVEQ